MARRVTSPAAAPAVGVIAGDLPGMSVGALHGGVSARGLVPLLMRMKWTLWRRSFRKNIGKLIGTIVGVLYGIGGLVGLALALGAAALLLDGAGPEAFGQLLRGLGCAVVLAWLVVPLFAFGLDDTLDPRRLAVLPRSARDLQPGLLAAATISLPSLFTLVGVLIATACEVLWLVTSSVPGTAEMVGALAVLLPANLLGTAMCLLLPRAIFAHSASRSVSRRRREAGGVIGIVAMLVVVYGFSIASSRLGEDGASITVSVGWLLAVARVLTWTPLGAAFSAPLDIAEGDFLVGIGRLVIAVAGVAALWLWWRRSLTAALCSALAGEASSGAAKVSSLVPRGLPPTPLGASVGRSLRYWRRDARYLAALGVLPVMALFFTAMGLVSPVQRPFALVMVVVVCGLSAISLCNEIGFDGPAGWVNLTAGIDSRSNLAGRILALATFVVPFAVLIAIGVPLVLGLAAYIPLVLLGSLGAMAGAWGVSCLIAVTLPYATSAPGTNPLRDKSASSANALIASFAAMLGMWVPQIPAIALVVVGLVTGSALLQLVAGIVSLASGVLALVLCLRGAARILDRRYVDLFQKVRAFL